MRYFVLRVMATASVLTLGTGMNASIRAADVVNRYLTKDVTAAVALDLTKLDMVAVCNEVVNLGAITPEYVENHRAAAGHAQAAFAELPKLGARRAYMLIRASDVQHLGSTYVVELAEGADAKKVAELLRMWLDAARGAQAFGRDTKYLPQVVETADNAVLAASNPDQMKLLTEARAEPRADAAEAMAALKTADAGLVAFGDPDSRRVVREMFPQLPAPFDRINGELLADGLKWFGLLVELPPDFALDVKVDASNPEAAQTFQQAAEQGLTMLKGLCMAAAVKGETEAASVLPLLNLLKADLEGTRLSLSFGVSPEERTALKSLLSPALIASRESAQRSVRLNHFKQFALAMFIYNDAKGTFPPAATYDAHGKPLLSWRVMILPYIEQQELYNQFHLDEPWDSEHNRTLIAKMPEIFADPGLPELAAAGRTTFLLPVGAGTAFEGREGRKLADITDGTSNTIMSVEVIPELAVVWTKPDDWEVDLSDPLRGVKRGADDKRGGVFTAGFCDGSVRVISGSIDPTAFKALLTRAGDDFGSPNP
jgi:hypothetical protein